jgi:transposase
MRATEVILPNKIFNFSGQSKLDTWKLKEAFEQAGWSAYSDWLVDEFPFMLQRIRDLADTFPFWQRVKPNGRPPHTERTLLIGFMLRQLFDTTFRKTVGLLKIFKEFFGLKRIPNYSILSRKNSSKRWYHLWKRFHRFVIKSLPKRKTIVATDATGFSGKKRPWRDTPYAQRPKENWVKLHATIEVDSFLILNYILTKSNIHESQMFESVWENLPDNVIPVQSLADSAYTGQTCLDVVDQHGAKAFHDVKCNAVYVHHPETTYEKLVNFSIHWPNRFKKISGKRAHVETSFSSMTEAFGYRIRCKNKIGRKNEVQAKIVAHNIRMLAASSYMVQV